MCSVRVRFVSGLCPVRVRFVSGLCPEWMLLEPAVPLQWWSSWLHWPGPWRRLREQAMPIEWWGRRLYRPGGSWRRLRAGRPVGGSATISPANPLLCSATGGWLSGAVGGLGPAATPGPWGGGLPGYSGEEKDELNLSGSDMVSLLVLVTACPAAPNTLSRSED